MPACRPLVVDRRAVPLRGRPRLVWAGAAVVELSSNAVYDPASNHWLPLPEPAKGAAPPLPSAGPERPWSANGRVPEPMTRFAVSVFGRDRPGIVAAVTRVLADAGCNLEDTSMTILRGHFAMMLVVAGPAGLGEPQLRAGLDPVAGRLDLQVSVRQVADEVTTSGAGGARYAAAVYGADRPGLVARVSEALAAHQVNIVDLQTRVIGEPDPVYAMHFELEVPAGRAAQVEADLAAVAGELGVEVSFHPDDADLL